MPHYHQLLLMIKSITPNLVILLIIFTTYMCFVRARTPRHSCTAINRRLASLCISGRAVHHIRGCGSLCGDMAKKVGPFWGGAGVVVWIVDCFLCALDLDRDKANRDNCPPRVNIYQTKYVEHTRLIIPVRKLRSLGRTPK